jgi:hypothetical protein
MSTLDEAYDRSYLEEGARSGAFFMMSETGDGSLA